jgi:S-DNA-T family DNA segregation ATPase FtsK/SpoIIIE
VTDPKKAAGALNWAVAEMTKRYQMFSECNVRNIQGYNAKLKEIQESGEVPEDQQTLEKMPQIVIIVDELADLMMVAKAEVEEAIVRLAQLARAAGIHLVIATQRPSVDVVTGLIKANVPSRIALSVSSGVDSRTIIDSVGAEKLLGNGDMLFYPTMYPKPLRVQGAYISDDEVMNVVEFLKAQNGETTYNEEVTNQITSSENSGATAINGSADSDRDEYFVQAGKFIIDKDKASIGMLQRMFKIGFNRAARIMDQLFEAGVVGPEEGTKPRQVLMSAEQFEEYVDEYF